MCLWHIWGSGYNTSVVSSGVPSDRSAPQRVAAVIPAHNVGHDVAATVRACRAIPGVDLLIVVDDGSEDNTATAARSAGAVVVRHSVTRGRASAIETGVKVAAMRDRADWPARHLLILSSDIGDSAIEATALVEAVMREEADVACAIPVSAQSRLWHSRAQSLARSVIRRATGWEPHYPLAPVRCATREAIHIAMPFMNGYGLEVAMTIDVLVAGLSMIEIPCHFERTGADKWFRSRRSAHFTDTAIASARKAIHRVRIPASKRIHSQVRQGVGIAYPRPTRERLAEGEAAQARTQ